MAEEIDEDIVDMEPPADPDEAQADLDGGAPDEPADLGNPKILGLPVEVTVSLGMAKLSVRELLDLNPDSIIKLDGKIGDPVDLMIGEKRIAQGELIEVDGEIDGIGVRLTDVCALEE